MKRLALLAIICLTGAQASLFVESLEAVEASQEAAGTFLWLQEQSNNPELEVSFTAGHMYVEALVESYQAVVLPGAELGLDTYIVPIPTETDYWSPLESFGDVDATLTLAQAGASMAIAGQGDMSMDLGLVRMDSFATPEFDYVNGMTNGLGTEPDRGTFTDRIFTSPLLISESSAGEISVTYSGTLVIEMDGLDFDFNSSTGADTVETSRNITTEPGVQEYQYRFARLHLTGAEITISSSNFNGILQAASTESELLSEQAIELNNATGNYQDLDLRNQNAPIPAGKVLLDASGDEMSLSEPEKETKPLGFMTMASSPKLIWLATPLLLIPFLRRRATLERMENAIEGGKFSQASKVARRIMRKSPDEERAVMGYVVAQSKMGLHNNVVNHLQRWLKSKKPSDGVFNYVLGLSYMELGETDVAAEQFAAAIKLTPSLKEEIPSVPVVAEHAYA